MKPVSVIEGRGPIVLAQPHSGTYLPPDVKARLNSLGRKLLDTDWHVPMLYDGLLPDATIVRANFSRYVIDVNRDPEGKSLYPGKNTTALVPVTSFDGEPIWNKQPTEAEVSERLDAYHATYHAALEGELERVRREYGFAVLYDCHSIRSTIPHLFEGRLPDLNIGSNNGETCAPALERAIEEICQRQSIFTYVVNGRFKGGWTTRHYGKPRVGIHAVQMELSQRAYLAAETPPFAYDEARASELRELLRAILSKIQTIAETEFTTESSSGRTV